MVVRCHSDVTEIQLISNRLTFQCSCKHQYHDRAPEPMRLLLYQLKVCVGEIRQEAVYNNEGYPNGGHNMALVHKRNFVLLGEELSRQIGVFPRYSCHPTCNGRLRQAHECSPCIMEQFWVDCGADSASFSLAGVAQDLELILTLFGSTLPLTLTFRLLPTIKSECRLASALTTSMLK